MKPDFNEFHQRCLKAFAIASIVLLLFTGCASGEEPDEQAAPDPTPTSLPDPEWSFISYAERVYSIVDMAVDPDGVVWTTGKGGAARWNIETGRIEIFEHKDGMPGYEGAEIDIDANGAAWVNWSHPTFKGYGVSRYYQGGWEHFSTEDGLADNMVTNMSPGPDGKMWFATQNGVSVYDTGEWQTFTVEDGLPSDAVNIIYAAPDRSVWLHTYEGMGFYIDGEWNSNSGSINRVNVNDIFQEKNGNIWFATSDYVYRFDGEEFDYFSPYSKPSLDGSKAFLSVTQTDDGTIWLNGAQGLFAWRNNQWYSFTKKEEDLPFFCAEGLFHDSNDTLWAISDNDGLFMIPSWSLSSNGIGSIGTTITCKGDIGVELKKLMSVDELDDYKCLDGEIYTGKAVELPNGNLILASAKKLTILYPNGKFSELAFPDIEAQENQLKSDFTQDRRIGPYKSMELYLRTLYQYDGEQRIDLGQENELLDNVNVAKEAPDGLLWIGSDYAVSVWDGTNWEHWTLKEDGENKKLDVSDIIFLDGDVLVADRTRGISRLMNANLAEPVWKNISLPDWPRDNNSLGITRMVADPKGGFWVIGFYGMPAYYDGSQWHLIPQDEYKKVFISVMEFAPNGDLWLGFRDETGLNWDRVEQEYTYYFRRFDGAEWHDIGDSENLPQASTKSIVFQDSGDVWVSFDNYGLVHYDLEGNFIGSINTGNVFDDSDQVRNMYIDDSGALIVNLIDGVARYGIPLD